jgi:hypothetical protein
MQKSLNLFASLSLKNMMMTTMTTFMPFLIVITLTDSPTQAEPTRSFLNEIRDDFKTQTLEQLKSTIETHLTTKHHYLSLGETHLEGDTSPLVLDQLINLNRNFFPYTTKFCFETPTALTAKKEVFNKWTQFFNQLDPRLKNSPSFTDFATCSDRRFGTHVIHSGLFHQSSFAKFFPLEFTPTPVMTESGNNILEQMPRGQGLFVSLAEMTFFEQFETQALLKQKLSLAEWTEAAKKLVLRAQQLQSTMQPLSPLQKKVGTVISSDQLEILKNFLGPTPYFWLITQLPDKAQEPFYFIQHFTQTLNAKTQTHLLDLLNNPLTRWAFGQLHFSNERNAQGDLILSTQAPGFDQYFFPGDSSFLQIKLPNNKGNLLVATTRTLPQVRCFFKNEHVTAPELPIAPHEVPCDSLPEIP